MTKIFYFCTHCACGLQVSDETCAACGRQTIDAHRVILLQTEGARSNRKVPRGAATATFSAPQAP